MTNDDLTAAITQAIQPLVDMVEIMKHKNELREVQIDATLAHVRTIKDQQSILNKKFDDLHKAVKALHGTSEKHAELLNQIQKEQKEMKKIQQEMQESLDANTASVMQMEATFKGYGDMYKINADNIYKLEKRIKIAEKDLGIKPSPELLLVK